MPFIDKESAYCIQSILLHLQLRNPDIQTRGADIDVSSFFRSYALNTSLSINYGLRLDRLDQGMLQEITTVEKTVGSFRASLNNYQDFLPFLRCMPNPFNTSQQMAVNFRQRRDHYMESLLEKLRMEIQKGEDAECIAGNILKGRCPTAKISDNDLKSICLTMVSAGLDTVPVGLVNFIGHMSQPGYGQYIQQRAYEEICSSYQNPWKDCLETITVNGLRSNSIPYLKQIVDETLRFSAMPVSLPRETIKDIEYSGNGCKNIVVIPKGTELLMNTYAANFDPNRYMDPFKFNPDRFGSNCSRKGPKHFTFGAGTRMCAGVNLAEQELYIAVVRLIWSFQITPPTDPKDAMSSDPLTLYSQSQTSLVMEPPSFKVGLIPRDLGRLQHDLGF